MSLFGDLFTGGYQDAANAAKSGYQTGFNQAQPRFDIGRQFATSNYGAALAPYTALNQQAMTGANAYGGALGIGGNPAQIQAQLAATPGYQFALGQGLQGIDRGAASRGLTTSGNTLAAEQQFGTGLADQTYQRYVQNLLPYLGQQNTAAAGIAGVNTGLGNTLNASYGNEGLLGYNTAAAQGNAQAAADIARQNAQNTFLGGVANLGGKLLGQLIPSGGSGGGTGGLY